MTFTFGGITLESVMPPSVSVGVTRTRHPVRPPRQRRKLTVPGRDGSWDFGPGRREDFTVEVDILLLTPSQEMADTCLSILADYVEGQKELTFSDRPGEVYWAQVTEEITAERFGRGQTYRVSITFECDGKGVPYGE